jgi:hypothetical protein
MALALVIASCLPVTVQAVTTNVTKNNAITSASNKYITNDCYHNCMITCEDGCIVITKTIVQNGKKVIFKTIITDQYNNIIYKILMQMQEKNKCLSQ